jgi:glycosyltransferase involved in cell wall biosynthesis
MPNQYLLFVGARKGYKNWKLAVRSLAQISKTHPNLRLILVGGGKILASERYLTIRLGVQNKVGVVSVSDRDLSSIYSNASALVYPSNFEGFGLPLLEAMASGVPIVASDIMINREVCGPAAFYFHKDDVNSLTYALSKALIKNQEVADLLLAGLERAKTFTWYKCAEATAQIYRRAASKRRV